MTNSHSTNGNFDFYLEDSEQSGGVTISPVNGTYKAQIDKATTSLTIKSNGKGLKMGDAGNGTLGIGGGDGKTVYLDLSNVATDYALQGSLFLGGWGSGVVNATFGGTGIDGDVTLKGGVNTLVFNANAKITGKLKATGATSSLLFDSTSTNGVNLSTSIAGQKIFSGGTTTFGFNCGVSGDNKIFSIKTSSIGTDASGTEDLIFAGGTIVFDGAKKIYFNNTAQGDGNLNVSNSTIKFLIDPTITQAGATFIDGSLTLNATNAFFAFKNTENITGINPFSSSNSGTGSTLATYNVDGNISIVNGGISAFWDDAKGFYGKIATTGVGHTIGVTGGLVGKNNAWFSSTINPNSIRATFGGTSHLIFDTKETISGFKENVGGTKEATIAIKSVYDSATQILFKAGAEITGNIVQDDTGFNEITFDASSSIEGDIIAQDNLYGDGGTNTITFNHGGTIKGNISATENPDDTRAYVNVSTNTITFNGTEDATIEGNLLATDGSGVEGKGNVIKFNGSGTNKIIGNIASQWGTSIAGRTYISFGDSTHTASIRGNISVNTYKAINEIVSETTSLQITGNITQNTGTNIITLGGSDSFIQGNIEVGGNDRGAGGNTITFNNGGSITGDISVKVLTANQYSQGGYNHNTITFGGRADASIIGDIYAEDGVGADRGNIISFNGSGENQISNSNILAGVSSHGQAGRNIITFGANSTSASIKGTSSITASGGTNQIEFKGANGSIVADIIADGNSNGKGGNTIVFSNGGSITGDISVAIKVTGDGTPAIGPTWSGYGSNEITFNGTNDATITGDISATDGYAKGNVIKFNGSGLNKIIGNITASADGARLTYGKNHIVFGASSTPAEIEGTITAENAPGFTGKIGVNQIDTSSSLSIKGDIIITREGTNNISLLSDGIGLSLNGKTSGGTTHQISSLTATSDGANILTLDNSANSITDGAMTTTIHSITNGSNLDVILKGQGADKGVTLTLDNVDGTTLKGITVESEATLAGTTINATNLDMSGAKVTFTATQTTIDTLTAQANANNEIVIGKAGADTTLTIGTTDSTLSSVTLEGDDTTLTINGGTQTINTLTLNANANKLNLANSNLTIGNIKDYSKPFSVALNDSTLSLTTETNNIDSLVASGDSLVDLAGEYSGVNLATQTEVKPTRKTLTIGALGGDLKANIFVSKAQADQIVINDADNAIGGNTLTLYARGNAGEIFSITRGDNILVADTTNATTNNKVVNVVGGMSDLGGLVVALNVEEDKDQSGNGTGKWYVDKSVVKGVDHSFQEVASTALAVNYDLYLANFNSLNKRMGELRDNPYAQGVWARVFGGVMSNDLGSGSKSDYVTLQAGYDYSLTLGDARNYIGIALAYGSSWTKANDGVGLGIATLDNIDSQMVEVGIYNSYVMDSGWYNDTILKFNYIMSDFDISASGNSSSHNTNNFAMILSDEFGYRYKFAENEKGNWYIDPQVEIAFGYFNQSDFNQAIADGFTTVKATQDAILTLRGRAGASLGKRFVTNKGFASLYVGAFYEYDYIEGGGANTQTLGISNSIDQIKSNGRAVVNIGSNIDLAEGARMYLDIEKSFGGEITTDYQINLGMRYSFGEKVPTASYLEQQKRSITPLKIEEEHNQPSAQEDKQENSSKQDKPNSQEALANPEAKQ